MPVSSNTTSADQVLLSFKNRIEGDNIPDETLEELSRRADLSIDRQARNAEEETVVATGIKQALSQTLAVGANELTFSWTQLFPNTTYSVCFYPTNDPGAVLRWWVKSKTTSQIVFAVHGHTNATSFTMIASP